MKSVFNSLYPDQSKGKDVYLQGSRQMDSLSRQYYERNLGAGMFVSPATENGLTGYSEPLRRFIQHEGFTPQVNEIANSMPSWIPGEDHLINFQKGDPYTKVDEGYARLPGAGWCQYHLHLVPPLSAHINLPTRARPKFPFILDLLVFISPGPDPHLQCRLRRLRSFLSTRAHTYLSGLKLRILCRVVQTGPLVLISTP
jgi:hypothetical protein